MPTAQEEANIKLVIEALDTLFNKRDYDAAWKYWSPDYIQRSILIPRGKEGLFALMKTMPKEMKWQPGIAVANDDVVFLHCRLEGHGAPPMIAGDWFRIKDGLFVEHWDVMQDEVSEADSKSKRPMWGEAFAA